MPLISTLGALAEFRQIGNGDYIILCTTPDNPLLFNYGIKDYTLDSPNNIYVSCTSNLGTPKYQTYLNFDTYLLESPNLLSVSTFVANANAESLSSGITKKGNTVYTICKQEYSNGNVIANGICYRTFDSTTNNVIDDVLTPVDYGFPNNIIINDSDDIVITANTTNNSHLLIYNGNTFSNAYQFSNIIGNNAALFEYNNGNYIIGTNGSTTANNISIFDINEDLVTINYNKTVTSNTSITRTEYIHKEGNSYFISCFGSSFRGHVAKITNNTVDWVKTNGANGQIGLYKSSFYNNKVFTATFDGINSIALPKIICFDANNGNVEWVNELSVSGTNNFANSFFTISDIEVNQYGIHLFTNINTVLGNVPGIAILKLPLSGAIPGSGNYNCTPSSGGNLFVNYQSSNISLSNGNLTISNGNASISNVSVANTINSNISANTTYNFIVTSKQIL